MTSTTTTQSAMPGTTYRYVAALDNYSPTRAQAVGTLTVRPYIGGPDPDGTTPDVVTLDHAPDGRTDDPSRNVYALDDGTSVRLFYVAGWRFGSEMGADLLLLHPITPGAWMAGDFGPRRMLLLTISPMDA